MATLREITYMVLDEIKATSDDSYFNEEHAQFLINKFRTLLLRQQYKDVKKEIPHSNYQLLQLKNEEGGSGKQDIVMNLYNNGTVGIKTTIPIPDMMTIATPKIYRSYYDMPIKGDVTFITADRMKYVGYNKWLKDAVYASIAPDRHLYMISANHDSSESIHYHYIKHLEIFGVFEDPAEAHLLSNDKDKDFLDCEYPLEEGLIPQVVELTVKELLGASYRPTDSSNNASDDLSNLATFLARNTKSELAKSLS
jgi:hypothetical protein